jgi:two-component system phosphate regulon sensor histidine kinase PhoR
VELEGRLFSPTVRLPPTATSAVVTISLRDVTERRQADERRLDFYSIIAHDLRSPLNAMSLRTDLILNGRHGELAAPLTTDIHKIKGSIQSLVVMINDFLEMARFEGAPITVDREPVDVSVLIDSAMESFRPLLEGGRLTWQRRACDEGADCRVLGDHKRLNQVFTNLVGNAIKFTPEHGTITTSIRLDGAWVEIAVEDTGRGVPAQAIPTLFDRYTRAASESSDVAGSGLGLMIVREIVEAHGGSVGVESQVGVGSRFWVRLASHAGVPEASSDARAAL